jgi:hypothetical protein
MYEEVVNFMMMLTPAPAIAAVIFGICYGVIEYMNDDLELFEILGMKTMKPQV